MTLAEKLRKEGQVEGEEKGRLDGERKVYKEAIELGITLKFPENIDTVMDEVKKINDLNKLTEITKTIYTASDISEILALTK